MDQLEFLAVLFLLVTAPALVWAWLALKVLRSLTETTIKALEAIASTLNRTASALAQAKGLHPHHADKDTFAPSGVAYSAIDKVQATVQDSRKEAAKAKRVRQMREAIEILKGRGEDSRVEELESQLELVLEEE